LFSFRYSYLIFRKFAYKEWKMRIFIIGFMGSGKSYTGIRLAQQLEFPFVDLDAYIEDQNDKSIDQIFEESGEASFRQIEKTALESLHAYEKVVVACGGGTPCFFDNIDWMKKQGTTIFLDLPPHILEQRLQKGMDHRPLIKNMDKAGDLRAYIESTLEARRPFYQQADIIFNPDNESLEPWIALEHWILYG
jgi:shikimate kinase